ncbi:MAG: hypothetical protein M3O70_21280 [Actinomycetota bacterium]|nr:hypothetical protein [Actinomycetota bacterium]
MRKWIWAAVTAVAAALIVMTLDAGVHVWNALVAAGVLTAPECPGGTITDRAGAIPMCVRPTSLTMALVVIPAATGLLAGVVAYRVADG